MAEAARKLEWEPRIIKISSKRQLTIPADIYRESGFTEYAYVTLNGDGSMNIAPIHVDNENDTVAILRSLLEQGFDGEALVNEYERIIAPVTDFKAAINQSLEDIDRGRTRSFEDFRSEVRQRYGV